MDDRRGSRPPSAATAGPGCTGDLLAGLTVWAVLVPESLAYATIAGVSPVVGLYAAVPSLLLYPLLGSSRHLVVATMSARRPSRPASSPARRSQVTPTFASTTAALALVMGVLCALAGAAEAGLHRLVHLRAGAQGLHHRPGPDDHHRPGAGAARHRQGRRDFFERLWGILGELGDIDWLTTRRRRGVAGGGPRPASAALPLVPASLVRGAAGIAAVAVFGLDDEGVDIVGAIDAGLPQLGLPASDGTDYLGWSGRRSACCWSGSRRDSAPRRPTPPRRGTTSTPTPSCSASAPPTSGRAGRRDGRQRQPVQDRRQRRRRRAVAGVGAGRRGADRAHAAVPDRAVRGPARGGAGGSGDRRRRRAGGHRLAAALVPGVDRPPRADLPARGPGRLHRRRGRPARGAGVRHPARAVHRHRRLRAAAALPLLATARGPPRTPPGHRCTLGRPRPCTRTNPPATDVVVLRVESGLFFANADHVRDSVLGAITPDTIAVVLDAETIPSIDVTGAGMLIASEPGCPSAASSCSSRSHRSGA